MTHDDPLKQLETAVRVHPSPEFAARVRVRVAGQPRRRAASWLVWSLAATAAIVTVAAGEFVWQTRTGPSRWQIAATIAPSTVTAPTTAPVHPAPLTQVSSAVPLVQPAIAHATAQPRPTMAVPLAARAVEVLVPPDEKRALDQLLRGMRDGDVTVPAGRVATDEDGYLVDPPALEIALLDIELLPGTPVTSSGGTD